MLTETGKASQIQIIQKITLISTRVNYSSLAIMSQNISGRQHFAPRDGWQAKWMIVIVFETGSRIRIARYMGFARVD